MQAQTTDIVIVGSVNFRFPCRQIAGQYSNLGNYHFLSQSLKLIIY
jgi:hypothetical protein